MKHKAIAERLILETLVWLSSDAGYHYGDAENAADGIADRELRQSDHDKIKKHIQQEAVRMRDNLVKRDVLLDGVPLPFETQ